MSNKILAVIISLTYPAFVNAATWGEGNWGEAIWTSISVNVPFPALASGIIFLLLTLIGSRALANKRSATPVVLLGALAIFSSIEDAQAQFSIPNQFTNGTTIDSAEMNANFQAIVDEINALKNDTSASGTYTVHMLVTGHNGEPSTSSSDEEEFGSSIFSGTVSVSVSGSTCSISSTVVSGSYIAIQSDINSDPATSVLQADSFTITFSDCTVGMNGTLIAKFQEVDVANEGGGAGIAVGVKVAN